MRFLLMVCGIAVFAASLQAGEVIKLPAPQKTGGVDVLKAIDMRASASGAEFPKGKLSRQDLSTLLWAASGLNRDGNEKWTVPMAMGRPPYTKVYVTDKEGVYLYDWQNHALVVVSTDTKAHGSIPMQGFGKTASTNIYMVPDMAQLSESSNGEEWGALLAGAMSQNIYLAAEAVGVGARLVYSIERERAGEAFGLKDGETALFAIILGKK
jgi:Nitroreductase